MLNLWYHPITYEFILRQKIRDTYQDGCIKMFISVLTMYQERGKETGVYSGQGECASPLPYQRLLGRLT